MPILWICASSYATNNGISTYPLLAEAPLCCGVPIWLPIKKNLCHPCLTFRLESVREEHKHSLSSVTSVLREESEQRTRQAVTEAQRLAEEQQQEAVSQVTKGEHTRLAQIQERVTELEEVSGERSAFLDNWTNAAVFLVLYDTLACMWCYHLKAFSLTLVKAQFFSSHEYHFGTEWQDFSQSTRYGLYLKWHHRDGLWSCNVFTPSRGPCQLSVSLSLSLSLSLSVSKEKACPAPAAKTMISFSKDIFQRCLFLG